MITFLKIISMLSFLSAVLQKRIINSVIFILIGLSSFVAIFIENNMRLIGIIIFLGYASFILILLAFNNANMVRKKSQKIDYINAIIYLIICTIICLILLKNHINMKFLSVNLPNNSFSKELFALPVTYFFSIGLLLFIGIISSNYSKIKFKIHKKFEKNTVKLVSIKREENE